MKLSNKISIIHKMPTELRRKLYKRGSSYETTIPKPLLFALDLKKKHNVVFIFDPANNKWYIMFEEAKGIDKSIEKAEKDQ
jgi:hypothetical protein